MKMWYRTSVQLDEYRVNSQTSLRNRIHNFFEDPNTPFGYAVQAFIAILILASVAEFAIEYLDPRLFEQYRDFFHIANYFILAVFTVEYILKVATAPNLGRFVIKPFSVIDFLAIAPNYLELILPLFLETTQLRVLRLLRFARLLRLLKFLRYGSILKKVLRFQGTILQNITPIIALFAVLKGVIWVLESYDLWFANTQLGDLFTIIGFALGIILSQKINVSYEKFIQVEESVVRIRSLLESLELTLNSLTKGLGTSISREWGKAFLPLLKSKEANTYGLGKVNAALQSAALSVEKQPADLFVLSTNLIQEAQFCLSKKSRLIPKPYDTLLHQSTMLYLALVAVFIPGATGMLSVLLATYMLYGMYNLTQDFDTIIGGEYDLINIDTSELEEYLTSEPQA